MKNNIAVVTGANGFVGSHLVDYLLENNFVVRCVVRKSSDLTWLKNKPVDLVYCGLEDIKLLEKAFENAGYIFHIAGSVKANNQAAFDASNVQLTQHVLQAALTCKSLKKLVITSSLAAAGPSKLNEPVDENKECLPVSEYGVSKLRQEVLAATYFERLPILIVRPPVVFGERDTEVLAFIKAVQSGVVPMAGMEAKYLSIIYVKDLVAALFAMANSVQTSKVYFVAGVEQMDWQTFGNEVAVAVNKKPITIKIPHLAIKILAFGGEIAGKFMKNKPALNLNKYEEIKQVAWTCSGKKAKQELGFEPVYSLQQGLKKTIDWYKSNGWI